MWIIVGLGNPGREYQETRHNVGFMVLDRLADKWDIDIKRNNFKGVFGEGRVGGERVILVKPLTFMNLSGECAREVFNWFKPEHDRLLVIYDDIDLPVGGIRIRESGSAGTHNGMRSVIYQLAFDDFPRLRVGIGGPDGVKPLYAHVLSMPVGEEAELLKKGMDEAAEAAAMIVAGELHKAQEKYNHKPKKQKPPKPEPADDAQQNNDGETEA